MHEKYTTRGCIVSASAYREADKIISIYTEDFGLVSAVAAGVRQSASKLRYHAQDYSVRNFSLVRGRDLWRFVGAEEIAGLADLAQSACGESLAAYARVLSLIRRLVRGEEKNERVFLNLLNLHDLLAQQSQKMRADSAETAFNDISALEALAVFRILHALGYIKSDATTEPLIAPVEMNGDLIVLAKPLISSMISAINAGLAESHL